MKNIIRPEKIITCLLVGIFGCGFIVSENVEAMTIEDPPERFGHPVGQCWGQGDGDDYTIKYITLQICH